MSDDAPARSGEAPAPWRFPPPLGAGARVALVSPSGPLAGEHELHRAIGACAAFGWTAAVGANALAREGYFAGPDAERAGDLQEALDDPDIDAIWCLRGGYGAMRLLDRLDWSGFRRRPRLLIGYSDVTALHLAAAAEGGVQTLHGPTARTELTPFSRDSLRRAASGEDSMGAAPDARILRAGAAAGRLAGGNLALLAAMAGTRWAPRFQNALVILEDINEATYRVDRMLVQLRLSGALDGARAILFGHCTSCPEEADDGGRRSIDEILLELADRLRVPCVAGLPIGHVAEQWTIPLGAVATLTAEHGRDVEVRLGAGA